MSSSMPSVSDMIANKDVNCLFLPSEPAFSEIKGEGAWLEGGIESGVDAVLHSEGGALFKGGCAYCALRNDDSKRVNPKTGNSKLNSKPDIDLEAEFSVLVLVLVLSSDFRPGANSGIRSRTQDIANISDALSNI